MITMTIKHYTIKLVGLLFLLSFPLQAQIFPVSLKSGDKLFFNVVDTTAHHVEIIQQPGAVVGVQPVLPTGSLDIPSSVSYKDVSYKVVAIHDKAFAKAEELTAVSIPSTVQEIGDKAFAGCSRLEGVIFPSAEPKISASAFEDCKALRLISFGSDWKAVNFALFSYSQALESVFIPAKVIKITNLKLIKTLQRVNVDRNNQAFSSIDGVLYSRDGKTLYACPCARMDALDVPNGVERIQEGAFKGCSGLTSVSLASTVHEFSYMDFAQCSSLKGLSLLSEIPPVTAKWNGSPVFAIRKPYKGFKVYVPSAFRSKYQTAVCDNAGEYENMNGKQKESITKEDLLSKKDIVRGKTTR